jgi:hypothetical protein
LLLLLMEEEEEVFEVRTHEKRGARVKSLV